MLRFSKLKVLGHEYEVRENPTIRVERDTSGQCCSTNLWISVDPAMKSTRCEETFLHEIFEALKWHLQIKIEHDHLSALSEGLYQVLKENGMKTEWVE